MKTFNYLTITGFIAIFALLFAACDKNELPEGINTSAAQNESNITLDYDTMLDSVAKIVSNIAGNQTAMEQILAAVNQNLLFGMGEEVRLRDILFPAESKIIDSKTDISTLTAMFCSAFDVKPNSQLAENMNNPLVEWAVNNDIEIYFPYSDEWNGQAKPLTVPGRKEQKRQNIKAYSGKTNAAEQITVSVMTDEYLQENPVLAVIQDKTPYADLPEFNKGIFEKNGVIWMTELPQEEIDFGSSVKKANVNGKVAAATNGQYDDPNKIYRIYMSNISFHEKDGGIFWIRPEVRLKAVWAVMNGNDTTILSSATYVKEFTQKQVNNGTEIAANYILINDWLSTHSNSVMTVVVWEVDGGNSTPLPIDLSIGGKFTIKTSIPIGNKDDFQGQIPPIERNDYFATTHTAVGSNGLTSDGFAYLWCGAAKFAIKYQVINR